MKDKIIEAVGSKLDDLSLRIDDVVYEKENNNNYLRIVLDADFIIDVNTVSRASKIIDPIIDELDLIDDAYILDIYAKEKGVTDNE